MTDAVLVPISIGELFDKISILRIKAARMEGDRLANVRCELAALAPLADRHMRPGIEKTVAYLHDVNLALWMIEDDIREYERVGDFGPQFIELARSVYKTNDRRAELKREINMACGSAIMEEKSYAGTAVSD